MSVFIMLTFLKIVIKDLLQKKIAEKDDFEILRWPYVTFNDLWDHALFNDDFTSLAFIEIRGRPSFFCET